LTGASEDTTAVEKLSLIVVGTGIRVIGQMTTESIAWIKVSKKVLYLVYDPTAGEIISGLNSSAESLQRFYVEGKPRQQSLREMVDRVMEYVRSGKQTCLAIFGHPGVCSWLGHEAVRQAREGGFTARMLPGISAADCLFADLSLDPGTIGCQSYEAMDFLRNGRQVDPSGLLLLWQIGAIGDPLYKTTGYDLSALPLLIERLCRTYDPNHTVIVYVAPTSWGGEPIVQRVPLCRVADAKLFAGSTLCIPPGRPTRPDLEVCERLKLRMDESAARRR
jgi:hypothetical protein